jgi:hypothetical protein
VSHRVLQRQLRSDAQNRRLFTRFVGVQDEAAALPPLEGGSKTIINGKCKVAGKAGKETKILTTAAHTVGGVSQWVLLTHEDFSEVKDWVKPNGKKIQEGVTCFQGGDDANADAFLGPRFGPSADCGNSFFSASKTFTLPEHTEVRLRGSKRLAVSCHARLSAMAVPFIFCRLVLWHLGCFPLCTVHGLASLTASCSLSPAILLSFPRALSCIFVPGHGHWPLPLH